MKLLLDEQLSPRLAESLADLFPGSTHVHLIEMGGADDFAVWEFARANRFVIVTKDSDFADLSVLRGHPPKVVWIRVGNCPTIAVERLLRLVHETIRAFVDEPKAGCLMLGSGSLSIVRVGK